MPDSPRQSAARDKTLYLGAVAILTLFCLWPIWALEFPPLQDYPQHLFLAHVNATYNDPAYNWQQYYLATLKFGPYAFFYLLVSWLDKIMPISIAGKLYLSLYLCLVAALAVALAQKSERQTPPWGSLLLFPLAFHQMYFMGFTNFLMSVPLLAFAVLDHQRFSVAPPSALAFSRQALMIMLLLLCHPYTILVYICLTGTNALLREQKSPLLPTAFIPPLVTAGLFLTWYLMTQSDNHGKMPLLWWPWRETLSYYLLMFTGMRWSDGPDWPTLLAWLAACAILLLGAKNSIQCRVSFPKRAALTFILATAGFFALPFWAGQYSYFNLRMAPISYVFAAILAGYGTLSPTTGVTLAAIAAFLTSQSAAMQGAISLETAEIKPLIARMRPNATILPMTFQTESAILDRHFFPEAHSHDYFYYHLLAGGGASPSLFPSPLLPVSFRPGLKLPLATHDFSWQEHGSKYNYILTRGAPAEFPPFLKRYAPLLAQSGEWLLFENERKR